VFLLPTTLLDRYRRRHWQPDAQTQSYSRMRAATVITGASEGIGRALAAEFARAGHELLLVARSAEPLAAAAAELATSGVAVATLSADLATAEGCAAVEAALAAAGAYCDVLVNNAAIGFGGDFAAQPLDGLDRLVDLNIRAVTNLSRRFLPGMISRGRGGILNVASLGALMPGPQQAAYYASKAYVLSLTEAIAQEVAGQGLRISALVPGPVATKFHARMATEHAYYLSLVGVMTAGEVARAGYRGFQRGRTLVYPGVIHHLNAVALRLLPHWVIIPVVSWMLRPRQAG